MGTKNGFNPVSDYLAWKYKDATLAMVYAIIERFTLMGKVRECNASVETLAQRIASSTSTVNNKINILERDGYLIDLSPRGDKDSHKRIITDKLEMEEGRFWEFAEKYLEDKPIKNYYEAFDVYAKEHKIEPYTTIIERPKKSRGVKKGQKRHKEQAVINKNNSNINNDNSLNEQSLLIEPITIIEEETPKTPKTVLETITEENHIPETSVSQLTADTSSQEKEEPYYLLSDSKNDIPILGYQSQPLEESSTDNNLDITRLASSDVDTSSESIEKRLEKLLASELDKKIKAGFEEEYHNFYSDHAEMLFGKEELEYFKSTFTERLEKYGY